MAKRWDVLTDAEREEFLSWLQPRLLSGVQVKSRVDIDITHDRRAVRRIIAMFGEVGWAHKVTTTRTPTTHDKRDSQTSRTTILYDSLPTIRTAFIPLVTTTGSRR